MKQDKEMTVVVTSAIVVDGRIAEPGKSVTLPERDAINLIRRGRVAVGVDGTEMDREAWEEAYRSLGGRPQDDWTMEELHQRLKERRVKAAEGK